MQIVTTLIQSDLNRIPGEIQRIESAGYDGVLTQENRHDPFLPLGVAAGGLMDLVSDSASYDMPGTLPPDVIQDIQRLDTPFRGFANTYVSR